MSRMTQIDGAGFNERLQNSALSGLHGSESFGDTLKIFHQGEVSFVSSDGFIQGPKVVKFPKVYGEFLLKVYDIGSGSLSLVSSDTGQVNLSTANRFWIESAFFVRRRLKQ